MVFVDSNAFVVLIIGLMDVHLLRDHKTTSIYEEEDFNNLQNAIGKIENILTTPNILTEVDNLLNNFSGHQKFPYIKTITEIVRLTTEQFVNSQEVVEYYYFQDLGLSDSIILHLRSKYDLLITADSSLSDHALSLGIPVIDLVSLRNSRF